MNIDIAAISLDVGNFRHATVSQERDAIRLLLSDESTHKVSELAQDIVAMGGLDPSSRLIVTEDATAAGRYIALEGNRRITALKTLMTPDLADGLPGQAIFRRLHPEFAKLDLTTVDCVVMPKSQASEWIKRKHYKGIGGKGVVQWNAIARAKSDAAEGRYTRWMSALAYLELHGVDAENLGDNIAKKTTTVERVLTSSDITSVLGLTFDRKGAVVPENGDHAAAVTLILSLFEAMGRSDFKETKVSTSDQQKSFLAEFRALSVKNPEEASATGDTKSENSAETQKYGAGKGEKSDGGQNAKSGSTTTSAASSTGSASRSKPVRDRKVLAEAGLRISNENMNRFYAELKKLQVDKNPYTSAAVIRIFLEKATTLFLEETDVPTLDRRAGATWHDFDVKLKNKVDAVLQQLDPDGKDPRLGPARDVANGNHDRLHSLDQLNRAIHDHHAMPATSEILTSWSRFHPYFSALFEAIENHRK